MSVNTRYIAASFFKHRWHFILELRPRSQINCFTAIYCFRFKKTALFWFTVTRSACLIPCAATQANALVPVSSKAAKNRISMFIRDSPPSLSDDYLGKAYAKAHRYLESTNECANQKVTDSAASIGAVS
jgi:hypothetical protein